MTEAERIDAMVTKFFRSLGPCGECFHSFKNTNRLGRLITQAEQRGAEKERGECLKAVLSEKVTGRGNDKKIYNAAVHNASRNIVDRSRSSKKKGVA